MTFATLTRYELQLEKQGRRALINDLVNACFIATITKKPRKLPLPLKCWMNVNDRGLL